MKPQRTIKGYAVIEPAWIYSLLVERQRVPNIIGKAIFPSEFEAEKWRNQLQPHEKARAKTVKVLITILPPKGEKKIKK